MTRLSNRAGWRLTRHFFGGMFDFGILNQAGTDSFTHMLLGGAGAVLATGFMLTRVFVGRYAALGGRASAEPYRRALFADDLLIVALPMLLLALVTLAVSDSLFPDPRDFRILGPLPVPKRVVFAAKVTALLLFNAMSLTVVHLALVPVVLITSMNRWREHTATERLTAWAFASVSACACAMLLVTVVVGVLVLGCSRGRLSALTTVAKSVLLAALVSCIPLVLRLPFLAGRSSNGAWLWLVPPAWFVGLDRVLLGSRDPSLVRLATIAQAVTLAAALVVAVAYTLLFRHFERLMLRAGTSSLLWSRADRRVVNSLWPPSFRAVYHFASATIGRSALHQTVLVSLSGCGLGIAINALIDADLQGWLRIGGPPSLRLVNACIWAPFALMFACGLGLRAALVLPLDHRANWIFRLTENPATRGEQLRAVEHLVMTHVVGPSVVMAGAVLWVPLGWAALVGTTVVALVGLLFAHAVLFDWRRIPFTASYLPGKRFMAHSLVVGCVAYQLLTRIGVSLLRHAATGPVRGLVVVAVLSLVAYQLRRRRVTLWRDTPLMFEDERPDRYLLLQLQQ